ncbi:MAG: DUF58 domain-containing protein [Ferruginibacter sp.]
MKFIRKYIGDLFIAERFYISGGIFILLFVGAFFWPPVFPAIQMLFTFWLLLVITDYLMLFGSARPTIERVIADRLSNGDDNKVTLKIRSGSPFRTQMQIIDELPIQLQERNFFISRSFGAKQQKYVNYIVRPNARGEYQFGQVRVYIKSLLGFLKRRHVAPIDQVVTVYPSYMQLRKYQLINRTAASKEVGSKRMRKIGQSMEFEQIKDYVTGDDIRNVNWKASARKGDLMINNYVDEKSQQVYCIIDQGRLMKMPFNGLSLLDFAINSCLVMANVCLQKQDKIGLLTFSDRMGVIIPAARKMIQREHILQALYRQHSDYKESDFEMLFMQVRNKIKQRSLIILYTNFESLTGLKRQVNYLRSIAKYHLLLVVFFENTELSKLSQAEAKTLEDVYVKTIAEKFCFEKRLIVKELHKYGIISILTAPENLTVNTVNKYIELKLRQAL